VIETFQASTDLRSAEHGDRSAARARRDLIEPAPMAEAKDVGCDRNRRLIQALSARAAKKAINHEAARGRRQ